MAKPSLAFACHRAAMTLMSDIEDFITDNMDENGRVGSNDLIRFLDEARELTRSLEKYFNEDESPGGELRA